MCSDPECIKVQDRIDERSHAYVLLAPSSAKGQQSLLYQPYPSSNPAALVSFRSVGSFQSGSQPICETDIAASPVSRTHSFKTSTHVSSFTHGPLILKKCL